MISYQWDSQPIMVKVKDKLRQAGYKVWMDVEHMSKYSQIKMSNEPRQEKTCFSHMQTTKVQISLHIPAVWSAPLLFVP